MSNLESHRLWRELNPEKWKSYQTTEKRRLWRKEYRAKRKEIDSKFSLIRNELRRQTSKLSKPKELQFLYELNIKTHGTLTCELCFKPIKFGEDSLDHLLPISKGGTNDFWNLAISHLGCNRKKGSKTMDEWFRLNPHPSLIKSG